MTNLSNIKSYLTKKVENYEFNQNISVLYVIIETFNLIIIML